MTRHDMSITSVGNDSPLHLNLSTTQEGLRRLEADGDVNHLVVRNQRTVGVENLGVGFGYGGWMEIMMDYCGFCGN